MYRKVLVPLDGSVAAEAVLASVQKEITPIDELILLRVIPAKRGDGWQIRYCPPAGWEYSFPINWDTEGESKAIDYLRNVVRRLERGAWRYRCEVAMGESVSKVIADFAKAEGVDLIALGNSDQEGLAGPILRTIAGTRGPASPLAVKVFGPPGPSESRLVEAVES